MKAIRTRYSGPTNTRAARIHATDSDGNRVSISFPYDLSHDDAHKLAAYRLMKKMNWPNVLISGGFGHDTYWVMLEHVSGTNPMWELVIPPLSNTRRCVTHLRPQTNHRKRQPAAGEIK